MAKSKSTQEVKFELPSEWARKLEELGYEPRLLWVHKDDEDFTYRPAGEIIAAFIADGLAGHAYFRASPSAGDLINRRARAGAMRVEAEEALNRLGPKATDEQRRSAMERLAEARKKEDEARLEERSHDPAG